MRVYISAAVILRLAVSCWTTRRAEYYVQAEWQTGGAEPDTAGGEQSELFKAANQSSNFSVCVCVCVSITRHSHTHTRLKRQRCKICSTLKHGPGKTAEPQTNGSQDRDGILEYWQRWKKKTQKDGGNERGRSLPIRQAKNSFACLRGRSSGCETPGEALFEFHWCRNQKK